MFKQIMGPYPPPMAEVMADDTPGETKCVLDLGCGSGSWSGCFILFSELLRLFSQMSQDNGRRSRLSALSGCRRRSGSDAICVSDLMLPD
jgi:hypothetical protein